MKYNLVKASIYLFILCTLHLFLSINALVGGSLLMIQPNGQLLGMHTDWLLGSPFKSYLIPGILLFSLIGLQSLVCFIGLIYQPHWKWTQALNLYSDRHWSWTFSVYSGVICISWIIIQQIMTRYFWIQSLILSIGLLILIFTIHPKIMNRYRVIEKSKN
ncbi:MAG: hypothetical protein IPK91_04325 [Saprospiraceae bacterium]|nr:hypothetical protein [Saprospiraceae bacterium]MBK8296502.1 hypothetical protein [Saprospiraceae bacterium]